MKAYEALDVNFGTKKVWGPDRHQERAREKLTEAKDKKAQQLTKKASLLTQQEESCMSNFPVRHSRPMKIGAAGERTGKFVLH
jgi:hypothetical protein